MNRLVATLFISAMTLFNAAANAGSLDKQTVVGNWTVASISTSDPKLQGLPIKTSGTAALQTDGTGDLRIVAKMGFLSQSKSSQFTWRLDDHDLHVYDIANAKAAVWKLVSVDSKRMEAEVPANSQTLRIVFIKA